MFQIYSDYYSINEFTKSLLEGAYDRHIFRALYKRSKGIGAHRSRYMDPTEEFEFVITMGNEEEPLIITAETMGNCRIWNPDYSEYERRLVMLLSFIIKDIHGQVLHDLKYEEMEASKKQPAQ